MSLFLFLEIGKREGHGDGKWWEERGDGEWTLVLLLWADEGCPSAIPPGESLGALLSAHAPLQRVRRLMGGKAECFTEGGMRTASAYDGGGGGGGCWDDGA